MKYWLPITPWQRMRASRLMPAWVSHCKYSICSCRFQWMSRSRHRYFSPSPTAQNPPLTEDSGQSKVVFYLSTRKSGHLTPCPRSWVRSPANQVRAWIILHPQLLLTTLWDQEGCRAPDVGSTAVPEVSLLPAASDQALWAQQYVVASFTPTPPKVTRSQAVNLNSPMMGKIPPMKMKMLRQTRVG